MSQQRYRLGNMDCANCAREVQSALERLPGVELVVVDFASSELQIEGDLAFDILKARVEALGKTIEAPDLLKTYMIGNMDCVGCAHEVEAAVSKLQGVHFAEVNFLSNKLQLIGDVDYARLKDRVESLGKTISIDAPAQSQDVDPTRRAGVFGFWDFLLERPASRMAVYGGALLLLAIGIDLSAMVPPDLSNLVYVLAMAVAMRPIAVSGINSLRISREFNINLLMTVAALGALVLGEFLEAATVIFLFAIGEALEGYTTDRARDSLRGLVALKPPTATGSRATTRKWSRWRRCAFRIGFAYCPANVFRWTVPYWRVTALLIKRTSLARVCRPSGRRAMKLRWLYQRRGDAGPARRSSCPGQYAKPHNRIAAESPISSGA